MQNSIADSVNQKKITTTAVSVVLLAFYFLLRIPVAYMLWGHLKISDPLSVYMVFSYFVIISALLWVNRYDLANNHIDKIFVGLFLIFSILFPITYAINTSTAVVEGFVILIALALTIKLARASIKNWSQNRIGFMCLVGLVAGFGLAYAMILINPLYKNNPFEVTSYSSVIALFLRQFLLSLGTDGILEEPIFRGFLWGILIKMKLRGIIILIVQAFFFWLSHLYYWDYKFSLVVSIPLIGIAFGLLAWRSKSVVPSILAHAMYNAVLQTFVVF